VPDVDGPIAVYHRAGSDTDEVIVPQNPFGSDFTRRMAEAVAALSEVEARTPDEVLKDLLLTPADALRFRVESANTEDGSVPLPEGISLLAGARKALLASACDVLYPQTFHPRLSRAEAEQFVSQCRLGQTERGSFVASVICPFDAAPAADSSSLFPDLPAGNFARRVTTHLMSALRRVAESINADQPERLTNVDGGDVVSANLYEALAEMQPSGDRAALHVTATWARTVSPPGEGMSTAVTLRKEFFPVIEEAARKLRPQTQPRQDLFVGIVDGLSGAPGKDGRMQGTVTLALLTQEGEEVIKSRLELSPEDYETACDAHKKRPDRRRFRRAAPRRPRPPYPATQRLPHRHRDKVERQGHSFSRSAPLPALTPPAHCARSFPSPTAWERGGRVRRVPACGCGVRARGRGEGGAQEVAGRVAEQ
jgi:hypothetical protein